MQHMHKRMHPKTYFSPAILSYELHDRQCSISKAFSLELKCSYLHENEIRL